MMHASHVPRRILYRALADACGGQARHLESIGASERRPGHGHPAPSKVEGRESRIRRLTLTAGEFSRMVGDPARYGRADVPAEAVGLLIALAYGHTAALADLRRLAPGARLDGLIAEDLVAIAERL